MMRSTRKALLAMALAASLLFAAAPALADDHDPEDSGHPLRIAAYVLHPIGVIIDTLIFRPAHWFVHLGRPLEAFFGHED
jgi:hypothetical protein